MTTTNDAGVKQQATEVAGTAKDQAAQVAGTATQAAGDVAGTAKEQAGQVVSEAVDQTRHLLDQTAQQLSTQAGEQTQRLATNLRQLAEHFSSMAEAGEQGSTAQSLVRQVADRAHGAAGYLEDKQPGDLVGDLANLGRNRPGGFLLGAAIAGFAAGRLITAARRGSTQQSTSAGGPTGTGTGVPTAYPEPTYTATDATGTAVSPGAPTVEPYPSTTPTGGLR